jgi:Flp pilus assembly protein TadG
MKPTTKSLLSRVIRDERGQIVPMLMAGLLIAMFGLTAISVDLGNVYLTFQQLQASTNAAALAGAQALPNTTASTQATHFSSALGNLNAYPNLSNVTEVTTIKCLTTLETEGLPCYSPAGGNAVQVTQSASVKLYFASLLGAPPVALSTTATAAGRGANDGPYNVVMILDTTASMGSPDGTAECGSMTRLQCAVKGIQTLLLQLAPCEATVQTCTVSGGVANNSVDNVALFTFPNVSTTYVGDDTNCSAGPPRTGAILPYVFPSPTGTTYSSNPELYNGSTVPMTYQVTNFVSNYRTGDTATSLSSGTVLTNAAGVGSCESIQAIGGQGTYYAGVIYAAQGALLQEQVTFPKAQNVMIMLSDGDATAASTNMVTTSAQAGGGLFATASGSYPSYDAECTQAVTAAQAAAAQGTRVYSIAYTPNTSPCTTGDKITPCQTMQDIASSDIYFYADTNEPASAACSSVNPIGTLQGIFVSIGQSLTYARLIPNGTT